MPANQQASGLHASYDDFPRIEEAFLAMLDESLHPRGPDVLYDIVAGLGLPAGSHALDLGCGEGGYSFQLAERFGFDVVGVDPVLRPPTGERHIELAGGALAAAESADDLRSRVRFEQGTAEAIPAPDASIDLIWAREMTVLVEDIGVMLAECRRVLRPGGYAVITGTFSTEIMEPREGAWLDAGTVVQGSSDPHRVETAIDRSGCEVVQHVGLGSEWGEFSHEARGVAGRRLAHAARLRRDPQRYIDAFGQANYEIMLADCMWHVYRMIGKLATRVWLLRKPEA